MSRGQLRTGGQRSIVSGKLTEMSIPTNDRWAVTIVAALLLASMSVAADGDKSPADGWRFDIVHHKNRRVFRGLILEETPTDIRFQDVRQRPGMPTVLFTTTFPRSEVIRIERL